jgi:protein TonB
MKALYQLILIIGLFISNPIILYAQIDSTDDILITPEISPEYPGGLEAMLNFIQSKLTYTQEAKDKKISGKVYIQFEVEVDGTLSDIKVVKGLGYGLDSVAINIMRQMPKWIPGSIDGKIVKSKLVIVVPVEFIDNKRKKR